MVQDKDIPTINLKVPTGWEQLDNTQLRYVFGLLAQGFPSPQVKTYCLFRWTGIRIMHKYGKGWWCTFADDEFVIMSPQVNAAIASLNWIDDMPDKTDITALKSAVNIIKGCGALVDGLRQSFFNLDKLGCTSANRASSFAFGLHKFSRPQGD